MKKHDIDATVRGLAPTHADQKISATAWSEMSDSVTSTTLTDPLAGNRQQVISLDARRRQTRTRILVAAACSLAVAGVVGATMVNQPDQSRPEALSFTERGDKLIVRVVDPDADPKQYNAEFKAMGLDVKVTTIPVSAPFVGTIVTYTGRNESDMNQLRRLEPGELCNGTLNASDPGCQGGLELPKDYDGQTTIEYGRKARPGEIYRHSSSSATEKGEVLAGLAIENKTVAQVLPLIEARGAKVGTYHTGQQPNLVSKQSVPGNWYVHGSMAYSQGVVDLYVGPKPEK